MTEEERMNYKMAYNIAMVIPLFFVVVALILNLNIVVMLVIFVLIMGCIPKEKKRNG
jgi:hypothetical protein